MIEPIRLKFRHTPGTQGEGRFSLDVEADLPGSGVIAIFGESGSGKTTLLRCLAGLEKPSHGYLTVSGEIWQDRQTFLPTHKRPIGCVFQEASLLPHLSARQNLAYGMRRAGTLGDSRNFEHIIGLMGISEFLGQRPHQLSGGQRQRVAIARALLIRPRLLLMDEPLASLDMPRKQEILPYLERLHREVELPVFYVSHVLDEVARLADHLVVLAQGRIATSGALNDVLSSVGEYKGPGDEAGVVIEAAVAEQDKDWELARLIFDGGALWVRDGGESIGQRMRVRVLARDVSLALSNHDDTSILNKLPATVTAIAGDDDRAMSLVQLRVGTTRLVARITRHSAHNLKLEAGKAVWAQVKSVAVVR